MSGGGGGGGEDAFGKRGKAKVGPPPLSLSRLTNLAVPPPSALPRGIERGKRKLFLSARVREKRAYIYTTSEEEGGGHSSSSSSSGFLLRISISSKGKGGGVQNLMPFLIRYPPVRLKQNKFSTFESGGKTFSAYFTDLSKTRGKHNVASPSVFASFLVCWE